MSKFDKIFEARQEGESQSSQNNLPTEKKIANKAKKSNFTRKKENNSETKLINSYSPSDLQKDNESKSIKQRGRPPAKRSDPNYLGFTTYIRRETHLKAKIALLQEGKSRELSELVESLLVEWLKKNT